MRALDHLNAASCPGSSCPGRTPNTALRQRQIDGPTIADFSPRGNTEGGENGNMSGYRKKIGKVRLPTAISASSTRRILSIKAPAQGQEPIECRARRSPDLRARSLKRAISVKYQVTQTHQAWRDQSGDWGSSAGPLRRWRAGASLLRPLLLSRARPYRLCQTSR